MISHYINKLDIYSLKQNWNEWSFTFFFRGLAIFCLLLGAGYWIKLIGVHDGVLWRFDLMPWHWRILCCSLASLYPIAACGLWMKSKWGIILWIFGAVAEIVCFTLYANYFELRLFVPLMHGCFMVVYALLTFIKIRESRKPQQTIAEY